MVSMVSARKTPNHDDVDVKWGKRSPVLRHFVVVT